MPNRNNISERSEKYFSATVIFFAIFYLVGIVGLSLEESHQLFVQLTPLALLLSTIAVAFFHRDFSSTAVFVFLVIYLAGFFIELVGVNTKLIFGNYTYGSGLGIHLWNTPLMIGINWLLLTYLAMSFLGRFRLSAPMQVFLAALTLVFYDLILEQVAPVIDMWSWKDNDIPLQNYVAWFFLALIFSAILRFSNIDLRNRLAPVMLLYQFLFFVILHFSLN